MPEIFTIPANSRVPVGFPARYLFIEDISVPGAEIEIEGYGDLGGERFSFAETLTEGASLSGFPIAINDWYFKNTSGVDLTVTIKAGLVYYQKNEFSGVVSGDVNSISELKNKSADGNQYMYAAERGSVVDVVPTYILRNPSASGVNALINKVHLGTTSGSDLIQLGIFDESGLPASYADDMSIAKATTGSVGASNQAFNKLRIGGYPESVFYVADAANWPLIKYPEKIVKPGFNGSLTIEFGNAPLIIEPGQFYAAWHRSSNIGSIHSIDWEEVPTV